MRADLQRVYGVRLREWLADRSRWGEILDLIDQLPSASRTKEALLNHPEYAQAIADAAGEETATKWSPPISEWTTDTAIQAAVFDRLGQLVDVVVGALGSKSKSQPFPRPVTEVDRIEIRARHEAAEDLIAMFGGRPTT